ncbi:MAG: hypothetical protein IPH05_06980 [Flavobacteriales bacterium]|nr:hypothetical protein [Flavobacteriales bacterium]
MRWSIDFAEYCTLSPLAALMFNNGSVFNGNLADCPEASLFNGAANGSGNFTRPAFRAIDAAAYIQRRCGVHRNERRIFNYLHNTGTGLSTVISV